LIIILVIHSGTSPSVGVSVGIKMLSLYFSYFFQFINCYS